MRTARCARYKRPAVSIYQQMASVQTINITDLYVDDIYYIMPCFRSHIWNVFFSVKTEKTRTWFIWFVWTRVRARMTMNIEQILKQTRFSTSQWRGFHNNSFLGINCICMSGHTNKHTNKHTNTHTQTRTRFLLLLSNWGLLINKHLLHALFPFSVTFSINQSALVQSLNNVQVNSNKKQMADELWL